MNGIATGNVENEHEQEHADRTQPIVLAQPRMTGRFWQLFQPLVQRFQFCRLQDRRDHRRQRVRDQAVCVVRVGGIAYGPERPESCALLREAAHQIQHGVDNAPRQIAPERADKHGADFSTVRPGDAE